MLTFLKNLIIEDIKEKIDFEIYDETVFQEIEVTYKKDILCYVDAYVSINITDKGDAGDYYNKPQLPVFKLDILDIEIKDVLYSLKTGLPLNNITNCLKNMFSPKNITKELLNELTCKN